MSEVATQEELLPSSMAETSFLTGEVDFDFSDFSALTASPSLSFVFGICGDGSTCAALVFPLGEARSSLSPLGSTVDAEGRGPSADGSSGSVFSLLKYASQEREGGIIWA
jgi:hypothetical protein